MPSDPNTIIVTKMSTIVPGGQNGGSNTDHSYHFEDAQGQEGENGVVVSIITALSMILIVITFPFSLLACMKMVQVSVALVKKHNDTDQNLQYEPIGVRACSTLSAWKDQKGWPSWSWSILYHPLHGLHRSH